MLSFQWTLLDAPSGRNATFDSDQLEDPTLTFTGVGAYEVQVVVSDGRGGSVQGTLSLEVISTPAHIEISP